ncbi:MAG TPA: hypothetical protein VH331_16645 [Allosphingosinicella sp.]|jgi:hypothetical protein|nr:hypothetical protein [Allosphingosinicella sp.]
MTLFLPFLVASAVTGLQVPASPSPVPDSAATLVPPNLVELRHFADALAAIAVRGGVTAAQVLASNNGKVGPADRAQIIRAHGLSPARYDYIATQVRYNERMARVVQEELRLASVGYR